MQSMEVNDIHENPFIWLNCFLMNCLNEIPNNSQQIANLCKSIKNTVIHTITYVNRCNPQIVSCTRSTLEQWVQFIAVRLLWWERQVQT